MNTNKNYDVTPQEHIMDLYAKTKDGKMPITYYEYDCGEPCEINYAVKWTKADAEGLVQRFNELTATLKKIAKLHDKLQDEAGRKELLDENENAIWNTYILPYEPFDVDNETLSELYDRSNNDDDLTEDEIDILERHYEWSCEQSLKRLPFVGVAPMHFITRVRRYEMLLALNAPEIIVRQEAQRLAEEMVLYLFSDNNEKLDQ